MQGILLKRHAIPGVSGCKIAPGDLQIGQAVTVYGRTYHITSVDVFTPQYLTEQAIGVAPDEQIPACPYDAWLAAHNAPGEPTQADALTAIGLHISPRRTHIMLHFASLRRQP